jgi:beta-N-acetylhexosaminidase
VSLSPSRRFVLGIEGHELTASERRLFEKAPPHGVVLFGNNLESAPQAVALIEQIRKLASPAPLLFVDQEGGTVDRLGPILGVNFPSASVLAAKGADRVHENAFLMGRAARLLGFDVDFAPVVDLCQPKTGAVILGGRTFGFHSEDVVVAGMMFLHGLARAGVASCLKHFPGLGRGGVDSHDSMPVIDAHDVDLMVTDVAPFTRLAHMADGVLVSHAAYPGFTVEPVPASLSPRIHEILRDTAGFSGVVYSDDLTMGALEGSIPSRAARAVQAGCDVVCIRRDEDAYEEAIARVGEIDRDEPPLEARLSALRRKCEEAPRPAFDLSAWERLSEEAARFIEMLDRPRDKRPEVEDFGDLDFLS